MEVKEGYMPYLDYKIYYRIVGTKSDTKKPLVLLHGGPGSTHNYFEMFDELSKDGRQIIMYDQLGCGLSSIPDDPTLWKSSIWIKELETLREYLQLEDIHVLGQSWGGMLAIEYLCDYKPKGISSLILSSTLPSSKLWSIEQHRLISYLPKSEQDAIKMAEETNDFENPAYIKANDHFMRRHVIDYSDSDIPEPVTRKKQAGTQSYLYAWGPNEYTPTGTLREFDYIDELKDIVCPTLITSGTDDLCTPYVAKLMYDQIPNSKWELFQFSKHMPFMDQNEKYLQLLKAWLNQND